MQIHTDDTSKLSTALEQLAIRPMGVCPLGFLYRYSGEFSILTLAGIKRQSVQMTRKTYQFMAAD